MCVCYIIIIVTIEVDPFYELVVEVNADEYNVELLINYCVSGW